MTDFETKVLEVVNRVLGPEDQAEWFGGTLFVECSEDMASLVESEMETAFRCRILRSKAKLGKEYAFDFA